MTDVPVLLTVVQESLVEEERRYVKHEPLVMHLVPSGVRIAWSDGETFTVAPDGEVSDFDYQGISGKKQR
jgi:hypothetical protein